MKSLVILFCGLFVCYSSYSQSVGINNTGASPDPSAMLDIQSTSKGVLIPRMNTTLRTGISSPATGLLVFDTTTGSFWYFTGASWKNLSVGSELSDADSDTKIEVEQSMDEDSIRLTVKGHEIALIDEKTFHLGASDGSVFIGKNAGKDDDGTNNNSTALGFNALQKDTTGWNNTAVGYESLSQSDAGDNNTAVGANAMKVTKYGDFNVAVGSSALLNNTAGAGNVALGYQTMYSATGAQRNVAIGHKSMFSNTNAERTIAIGNRALYNNDNIDGIIAIGDSALFHNSIGAFKSYHSLDNTAIGDKALKENHLGDRNTALGTRALMNNTAGQENIAIGVDALNQNSTGHQNVAIGNESQLLNNNGNRNVSVGHNTLQNTSGSNNVALGYNSLSSNMSGQNNVGIGTYSSRLNETGDYNIAIGNSSLYKNKEGINNISIGSTSLYNSTSNNNIAIGRNAAHKTTSGEQNLAIGLAALYNNTSISEIVAIGDSALYNNGLGASGDDATLNTAVGFKALRSNEQGKQNTALGHSALTNNDYANYNTAVGSQSLQNNVTGNTNTALGASTLTKHTGGSGNLALGYSSLFDHLTGANNTAVGTYSLLNSTSGTNNVALGYFADGNNETGTNNTIIGYRAGKHSSLHSKSGNVFLGYEAGYSEIGNNKLYIENSNSLTPLIYGEFDNDYLQINGKLNINDNYDFPLIDGTSNQVMSTNGSGEVSWRNVEESQWSNGTGGKIYKTSGNVGINVTDPEFPLDVFSFGNAAKVLASGLISGDKIALQATAYNAPFVTSMDSIIAVKALSSGSAGTNIGILTTTVSGSGQNIGLISQANGINDIAAKFDGQVILGNSLETSNQVMIAPKNNSGASGDASLFLSEDKIGNYGMYWEYNGGDNMINLFGYQNGITHGSHISVGRDNGLITFGDNAFIFNPNVSGDSRFTTDELEIRGGSDLAENFDITIEDIVPQPGMIVSIDPNNIGKLTVTSEPKDKKIAGIISGANGIDTGMYMGQKGSIADGEYPIALTGRVYVLANLEGGIIRPGDLLTSSNQSGFACKVENPTGVEGAIIGKSMSGIDQNGYVLVLVNLQ